VRDVSAIVHEKVTSQSESRRLDTRSDISASAASQNQDRNLFNKILQNLPQQHTFVEEPRVVKNEGLKVDDISFESSSEMSYTIKNLDMQSIVKYR